MMRQTFRRLLAALALLCGCAMQPAFAQDLPAPAVPSKALPAAAPATSATPEPGPAPCVARPLTTPGTRAGAVRSSLWPNGTTLRIYFHGGDERVITRILADWRAGWGADANLALVRVADFRQSDIRCTFQRGGGNWSLIGVGARTVPAGPTMNLDVGPETPPEEIRRLGEHEIGHAIGLQHNMSLPDPTRRLDKAAMVRYYQQTQGWSYQQAAAQVQEVAATTLHPKSVVDFDSIMQYAVPAFADRQGIGVGWITDLSPGDRASIRAFYPRR